MMNDVLAVIDVTCLLGLTLSVSIVLVSLLVWLVWTIGDMIPKRKLYEITYSGCADYTDLYSAWSEQGAIRQWKKHHSRTVYRITEIKCVGKTRL
jgi:hypothetical protein